MNNILQAEEIKNYKDIGKRNDVEKINPIISQAQDVDLRDHLGMKFYFDVVANIDNSEYQDLLTGSTFSNNGITYYHEGIKAMLADLFMARFSLQININFTPFGATIKTSNDSEPADRNTLKDIAQANKEMAGSKWEIIRLYLEANKDKFPNYNTRSNTIASGERRLKFRRI